MYIHHVLCSIQFLYMCLHLFSSSAIELCVVIMADLDDSISDMEYQSSSFKSEGK